MAERTISNKMTEGQIERMHNMLDLGYKNLSPADEQMLDTILDLVTTALYLSRKINLIQTGRIRLNNVVDIDAGRITK